MLNAFNEHRKLAAAKVERRLNSVEDKPDFMSFILKHNDTDKGMTQNEIRENASVLIIAGSETVYIPSSRDLFQTILIRLRLQLFSTA